MNVSSPCVNRCQVDRHGICLGCFRSLDEIARWMRMSDREKSAVNAALLERQRAAKVWGAQPPRLPFDAPSRRTLRAWNERNDSSVRAAVPTTRASLAAPGAGALPNLNIRGENQ